MQVISDSLEFIDKPREPNLIHLVGCHYIYINAPLPMDKWGEAQR